MKVAMAVIYCELWDLAFLSFEANLSVCLTMAASREVLAIATGTEERPSPYSNVLGVICVWLWGVRGLCMFVFYG